MATYEFAPAGAALLNDVIVTQRRRLLHRQLRPRPLQDPDRTRRHAGNRRDDRAERPGRGDRPGDPNLNGIEATANGSTLIVNHTALGALFTVDPATGASAEIAVDGLIPGTPDGLLLARPSAVGRRELREHARAGDAQPRPLQRHDHGGDHQPAVPGADDGRQAREPPRRWSTPASTSACRRRSARARRPAPISMSCSCARTSSASSSDHATTACRGDKVGVPAARK